MFYLTHFMMYHRIFNIYGKDLRRLFYMHHLHYYTYIIERYAIFLGVIYDALMHNNNKISKDV